jgi:hypothetical protein
MENWSYCLYYSESENYTMKQVMKLKKKSFDVTDYVPLFLEQYLILILNQLNLHQLQTYTLGSVASSSYQNSMDNKFYASILSIWDSSVHMVLHFLA